MTRFRHSRLPFLPPNGPAQHPPNPLEEVINAVLPEAMRTKESYPLYPS